MFLRILVAVSSISQRPASIFSTNHTPSSVTLTTAIADWSSRFFAALAFLETSSKPAKSIAIYHEPLFGSSPNFTHSSLNNPEPALLKEDKYSCPNAKELRVRLAASISLGSMVSLSAVVKCQDFQSASVPS